MANAVEALVTTEAPLRDRLVAAEVHFGKLDPDRDLDGQTELSLYLSVASTLVSGGEDEQDEYSALAVRESIAELDDATAAGAAMNMLRLYEVTGPRS
jgi:hypothetical protein